MKNDARGLRRLYNAFFYSMAGFKSAFCHEEAFRQEVFIALIFIPVGLVVGSGAIEKILLVGSVLLVLIVELLNSGIEAVVDRVGAEYHDLAKRAKDYGSAAVLLSLLNLTVVWVFLMLKQWV